MICHMCNRFELSSICERCLGLLSINLNNVRRIDNGVEVISSFYYSEVKELISAKNYINGSSVLRKLSSFALTKLFEQYDLGHKRQVSVAYIGEYRLGVYSHGAVIARCFAKYGPRVLYGAIRPNNDIKYTALNLEERMAYDRDFTVKVDDKCQKIILVDDVCTTGKTLTEASNALRKAGKEVIFAFCLADARL